MLLYRGRLHMREAKTGGMRGSRSPAPFQRFNPGCGNGDDFLVENMLPGAKKLFPLSALGFKMVALVSPGSKPGALAQTERLPAGRITRIWGRPSAGVLEWFY